MAVADPCDTAKTWAGDCARRPRVPWIAEAFFTDCARVLLRTPERTLLAGKAVLANVTGLPFVVSVCGVGIAGAVPCDRFTHAVFVAWGRPTAAAWNLARCTGRATVACTGAVDKAHAVERARGVRAAGAHNLTSDASVPIVTNASSLPTLAMPAAECTGGVLRTRGLAGRTSVPISAVARARERGAEAMAGARSVGRGSAGAGLVARRAPETSRAFERPAGFAKELTRSSTNVGTRVAVDRVAACALAVVAAASAVAHCTVGDRAADVAIL
jgi:hypothetical protein